MGRKKKTMGDKAGEAATSFIGGLVFTIILVAIVPAVCDYFIQPVVEDIIGDTAFMWFSSSLIVTIIMLAVLVVFMMVFGGSAILKKFGLIGVVALIVAYWLLGNIYGAILPLAALLVMWLWSLRK